ncbi:MAG: hypothetical protein WAO83_21000 [Fuerstiella sp.]
MTDISNRAYENTAPQTRQQVVDTYFMEHRAKLVDIAAYLDRIDRGQGDLPADIRDIAFRKAINVLTDGGTFRARRILELFSDFSTELPQSAEGMKGAAGAVALDGTANTGNLTVGGAS